VDHPGAAGAVFARDDRLCERVAAGTVTGPANMALNAAGAMMGGVAEGVSASLKTLSDQRAANGAAGYAGAQNQWGADPAGSGKPGPAGQAEEMVSGAIDLAFEGATEAAQSLAQNAILAAAGRKADAEKDFSGTDSGGQAAV
jgi:hypothetical protein